MRAIFTYPNNAPTYIDPTYLGDDSVGFQKRIKDLRDGDYLPWNGHDPTSFNLQSMISGLGTYYKMYDNLNSGQIKINDFYEFPLVTLDTTRILNNATDSDTANSAGATVTVTGHQFVDADRVELSAFDGTLASNNGQSLYVDSIDADTVRLFYNSELTDPVLYTTQLLDQDIQSFSNTYYNGRPGSNIVQVRLDTVGSHYSGGTFIAGSSGGSNAYVDRLNALGTMYINYDQGNWFSLYEDAALTNPIEVDEFYNLDYTAFGDTEAFLLNGSGDINLGNTNIAFIRPQYTLDGTTWTASYPMFSPGSEIDGPFSYTEVTPRQDGGDTEVDGNVHFPLVTAGVRYNTDRTVPGRGRHITPSFATNRETSNSTYHYNTVPITPQLRGNYGQTGTSYDEVTYWDIVNRDTTQLPAGVPADDVQLYIPTDDVYMNATYRALDLDSRYLTAIKEDATNELSYTVDDAPAQTNTRGLPNDNNSYYWHWRYDDRTYNSQGVMSDGNASQTNFTAREVSLWKRTDVEYSSAILFNRCEDILTNNLKQNVYAYLGEVPVILSPYSSRTVTLYEEWTEIRCVALPQYGYLKSATQLQNTTGINCDVSDATEQAKIRARASNTFPIDLGDNDLFGTQQSNGLLYDYDDDVWWDQPTNSDSAYTEGQHIQPHDDEIADFVYFAADNDTTGDSNFITISNTTVAYDNANHTGDPSAQQPWDYFVNGTKIAATGASGSVFKALILKSVTDTQKEFWVVDLENSFRFDPDATDFYSTLDNGAKGNMRTIYGNIFDQSTTALDTYWDSLDLAVSLRGAKQVRLLPIDPQADIGTADVQSGESVVDSTTGVMSLNNTTDHNYKVTNLELVLPGNKTYLQRTGEDTYVNNAALDNRFWYANTEAPALWDTESDVMPHIWFATNSNGYLTGVSVTNTGRINEGSRSLAVKTLADTYTPPVPSAVEQQDIWDTDDEWTTPGFDTRKEWPTLVTPSSASINLNTPSTVNNSQNGIKYTRASGFTKWTLDVEYPPMNSSQFREFQGVAQAANGQATPFYFVLRNRDGNSILWSEFNSSNNTTPVLREPVETGDTTMLLEGFESFEDRAFSRGEVFTAGENQNGSAHSVVNTVQANAFGEAKIRTAMPLNNPGSIGDIYYKNPYHVVVTLDSDDFVYSVDTAGFYYLSVKFALDGWK